MGYPQTVPPDDPAPTVPLSAWIGALVITLFAAAAAWTVAIQVGAPPAGPFVDFNRSRIDVFRSEVMPADAAKVVIIGSSVIKYATRQESVFSAAISSAIGRPVRVLRIVSNWGTFSDYVPLMQDLVALRPDLVVLQRELLGIDRPRTRSFLLWIEGIRVKLGIASPLVTSAADEAYVQFEYPCWMRGFGRALDDHVRERDDWVAYRPDGPAAVSARQFVEDLLATGSEVALVEIPMRPDYDREIRRTRRSATSGSQFDELNRQVQAWELGPLDSGLFCDLTHVNHAGQQIVSDWLESKVAEVLAKPVS
jgi:hypothetical protein